MRILVNVSLCVLMWAVSSGAQDGNPTYPGYQGIWFTLGQVGEYGDKYSGGLGTYTAKHRPIAVYAAPVNTTFFVYGGAKDGKRHLLNMIGSYDHGDGTVSRPVVVHDKGGVDDPHDNASIAIDGDGHLWVFVSGRGRSRPGFKYRSAAPYDISRFERISEEEFTYPQPVWIDGEGFLHCFTKYTDGRELYWNTSADGADWTRDRKLAGMGGHYQNVEERDGTVFVSFNYHPNGNVDKRTNLYFLKTDDFGKTWRTVSGEAVETPLTDVKNPALVRDYESEGRLVYLKDVQFDAEGRPVLLVITSGYHMPGPKGDPRVWTIVRWDGAAWRFHEVTRSTHNYDMGQLWIEGDVWRVLGPTERGPQRWGAGGEIALWENRGLGVSWIKVRDVTSDSALNHTYVRRPLDARDEFYALWADGHPDVHSPSRLYFTNRDGTRVYRLPYEFPEGVDRMKPVAME